MLLHSKFRDYYDTAIAYGVDTTCHYVRKTNEFFKGSDEYKEFFNIVKKEPCNSFNELDSIVHNPILKDLEFYKVYDAASAFQELSMFISGVLSGQSPKMVELADKDKINKRGFNKYSFRKGPTKHV